MEVTFYLSGLVAVLATFRVITHNQPVHALLYLIISLVAIACVFFSLGAYFAGALEIIVYAGAIMVMFVFVMMMLNIGVGRDKQERTWLHPRVWIWPSILSLLLLTVLISALAGVSENSIVGELIAPKTVGIALFSTYVLAVEMASILLLAGLLVACHLGRDEHGNVNSCCTGLKTTDTIKKIG